MVKTHYIADALKEADLMAKILAGNGVTSSNQVPSEFSSLEERAIPFAKAVVDVFEATLRLQVTHKTSFLVARNSRLLGAISATMELTGDFNALVAVSFDSRLARLLAARMARCAPEELTQPNVLDGVGEIVNQVSGRARTSFYHAGLEVEIDLPALIGKATASSPLDANSPCHILIFRCLNRHFAVQVSQPATVHVGSSG